ncbi:MAG: hypothetical protein LBM27_00035 [Lactobacillaceae bacterium]|jgi:hypothetical protein|nr:hypothetical protein [Lactobacillaceae bacterium]
MQDTYVINPLEEIRLNLEYRAELAQKKFEETKRTISSFSEYLLGNHDKLSGKIHSFFTRNVKSISLNTANVYSKIKKSQALEKFNQSFTQVVDKIRQFAFALIVSARRRMEMLTDASIIDTYNLQEKLRTNPFAMAGFTVVSGLFIYTIIQFIKAIPIILSPIAKTFF